VFEGNLQFYKEFIFIPSCCLIVSYRKKLVIMNATTIDSKLHKHQCTKILRNGEEEYGICGQVI